ncbi:MAG: hypothetical protein II371_02010 [Flavobacteriales bacterium]|jgi:hypothetical protein|nr:hypothetical protein [Flavobacteriales bacterium]MBQ1968350.1 hypothetical protein [Flavobacteriales bacterium]MBQ5815095.1 hypothetical protein [Flavobacteriales bacterium]MBR4403231.1 hypothetical protein [Flavobacteriales bacterium]
MSRDITSSSSLSGANMTLVLLSVVAVGVMCNVGYTLRWVEWCNMSDVPYGGAVKNIVAIMAAAMMVAFIAKDIIPVRRLWAVVGVYAVFYAMLPTCMFFADYLLSSMMMTVVVYMVWNLGGRGNVMRLFLAAFITGVSMCYVPSTVLYMLLIYAGVFIFCPEDSRNWLMPLVGFGSSILVVTTVASVNEGVIVFPSQYMPSEIFHMPYTEKIFASQNMYFYIAVAAVFLLVAYVRYMADASRDTQMEKKRAMLISVLLLVCVAMALSVVKSRYMVVFASLPFALIVGRYVTNEELSKWRKAVYVWALAVVAVVSMWTFE